MPHTIYGPANLAFLSLVVVAALVFGGGRERLGALSVAGGTFGAVAAQRLTGALDPAGPLFLVDVAVAAALIVMTWRATGAWPFVATAFQGVALAVHLIRLLTPGMHAWTYLTALAAASYGVGGALAYGVWRRRRELRYARTGFSS